MKVGLLLRPPSYLLRPPSTADFAADDRAADGALSVKGKWV